ncbi:SAM-dependent methyltransferase [Thalassomonas actiniarum]|uniref:Class I SAM-dependent methyltransferase n=1 Tax=Thalassomonas actiniarum TaxID=485447 RepID=A0AAE9YM43_9GAMM|nr:class I SAM-dependent methyltransferase [Thalassomonas actiniarum]WDD96888.1 class I SAM-dependent methyltransferase [Thalassomonas actiniarum]
MWDQRYATKEYAYGTKPNEFLQENVGAIPKGKVLSLAEGEGRNAVFMARLGYQVTAVDSSRVGLAKAQALAQENGVSIECIHADLADYEPGQCQWDGIVSIFCPLPSSFRQKLHEKVMAALKPQGVLLLENYTPEQLSFGTGGGNSADTMITAQMLRRELAELNFLHLKELQRSVVEGIYHTGQAAVVQVIAVKS